MKNAVLLFCFFPLQFFAQKEMPFANKIILTQVVAEKNKVKLQKIITVYPSLNDTDVRVVEFDTKGKILHKTVTYKRNKPHDTDRTDFNYNSNGQLISSIFVHGNMIDSMVVISQLPNYVSRTFRGGKLIAWNEKKGDSINLVETKVTISGKDTDVFFNEWKQDHNASGKLLRKSGLNIDKQKGKTDTTFYWATNYFGKSDSTETFQFLDKRKIYQRTTSQHDSIHHTRTYFYYDEKGKFKSSSIEHLDSLNRVATRELIVGKYKFMGYSDIYHYDDKGHFLGFESVEGRKNKPFYQVIDTYNSDGLLSGEKRINAKKVESNIKYEYEYFQK